MKRVLVIGCSGAGKSVLARVVGETLNLPVVHLDKMWWRPGWVEASQEEFDRMLAEELQRERWIMDGNYSRTLEQRIQHADTVLFLQLPRLSCLKGIFKRRLQYRGRVRPDVAAGCPERIDWEFFRFVWNYNRRVLPEMKAKLERRAPQCRLLVMHSRRDVRRFLDNLGRSGL